jgi:hypothetical protein
LTGGETEVLGDNLPQCRFVHHKPHVLCPDVNPGRRGGKPSTNGLSYGTAFKNVKKIKLSPCLINEALCHEGVWGMDV